MRKLGDTVMKKLLLGLLATSGLCLAAPAMAADYVAPEPAPVGGFFGYIQGGYLFEDAIQDWRLFDTPAGAGPTSKESFGDGWIGQALLGYRWSDWDFAVGGQFADFSKGGKSAGPNTANEGRLWADMWAIDGQFGYNTMIGETAFRAHVGVRYAEWDHDVNPDQGGAHVDHDFRGIGPRVGFDGSTPVAENLNLIFGAGAAVLFGKIKTDSSGPWICTDCSDQKTTAFVGDAKLGLGWAFAPGMNLTFGYQLQYWDNVNVAVTDNTGQGNNSGKSDHLIHGPFVGFTFNFGSY